MPSTTTTENHSLTYPAEGAEGWYATWETLMQQITDYMDDITNMRMTSIKDDNGNEQVVFTTTASAVNHLGVTNAATGNHPNIAAVGDDTNINLELASKGSGSIELQDNTNVTGYLSSSVGIADSNGNEVLTNASTASAVNEVNITNAATGNDVSIEASGDDTNVGLDLKSKGTGELGLFTNGNEALNIDSDGLITLPLASTFLVKPSADLDNVTGDGTTYTIVWATEIRDRNSDFDGTSTYTCPKTGIVRFDVLVTMHDIATAHTKATLQLVTSNRTYILGKINAGAVARATTADLTLGGSIEADMDASDTATVQLIVENSTKVIDIEAGSSFFSGRLVG